MPIVRDLDVGGFQITMHDARLVRDVERVSDLLRGFDRRSDRDRTLCDPIGQRVAFDEFEHERRLSRTLNDVVDRGDVRMIECGQRARLALESGHRIPIGGNARREDLDRDIAAQARIACAIHLAHSS
jgi:hypothetical protein